MASEECPEAVGTAEEAMAVGRAEAAMAAVVRVGVETAVVMEEAVRGVGAMVGVVGAAGEEEGRN